MLLCPRATCQSADPTVLPLSMPHDTTSLSGSPFAAPWFAASHAAHMSEGALRQDSQGGRLRRMPIVERGAVLTGFRAEGEQLAQVMLGLDEAAYSRPTPCPPWTVAELFSHVLNAIARTSVMLAAPEPGIVDTDAVGYYRPGIFTPETDAERIDSARRDAAGQPDGRALAENFDSTWRRTYEIVRAERDDRRVTTRHGDGMLLTDFIVTRVAELVLHGLDLAIALDREPWTTPSGADVVEQLLLTAEGSAVRPKLAWDGPTFLAKATGRMPLDSAEAERVRELRIGWITLG